MKVNHINYPDNKNQVYCKQKNSVVAIDSKGKFWRNCLSCKYFNGSYQGNGVECLYEDTSSNSLVNYYDDAKTAYNSQNLKA